VSGLLVYDGDCEFCTAAALRLAGEWTTPADVLSWQQLGTAGLAARGLTPNDARSAPWWIDGDGRRHRGPTAIAHALIAGGGWHGAIGRVFATAPASWLGVPLYWAVSRRRHRLPTRMDTFRHPAAQSRV